MIRQLAMASADTAPPYATPQPVLDHTVPNLARVHNYLLGGKDNYAADRELVRQIVAVAPETPRLARASRAFLRRAVRYCAERGIDQFLDLGPELPVAGAVHEVAQAVHPEARVVYASHDPLVRAHAQALLCDGRRTRFLPADLRHPDSVVADLGELLDLDRPIAVLLMAVLPFLPDHDDPRRLVDTITRATAPGSALVLTHDARTPRDAAVARLYARAKIRRVARDRSEVERFFIGGPLVEPGLVDVRAWRSGITAPRPRPVAVFGGVGQVPEHGHRGTAISASGHRSHRPQPPAPRRASMP